MKKKIALFGCGWSNDYVTSFMRGIEKAASKHHKMMGNDSKPDNQ